MVLSSINMFVNTNTSIKTTLFLEPFEQLEEDVWHNKKHDSTTLDQCPGVKLKEDENVTDTPQVVVDKYCLLCHVNYHQDDDVLEKTFIDQDDLYNAIKMD